MKIENFKLPKMNTRAQLVTGSYDATNRTISVIASTGARVKMGGYYSEPYYQELQMSAEAIDLRRFQSGAPALDNHSRWGSIAEKDRPMVLGVIENARLEGKNLVHDIRFSKRKELDPFIQDVADGIVRNVSIGFKIHENKEVERAPDGLRVFRAMQWEPMETSFTPVGADAGSVTRSDDGDELFNCQFNTNNEGGIALSKENETPENNGGQTRTESNVAGQNAPAVSTVNLDQVRAEAVEAERSRVVEIRAAVASAKLGDEFAHDLITRGVSADDSRKEVLKKLAALDKENQTVNTRTEVGSDLHKEGIRKGITEAILHRISPSNELSEQSRTYAHRSLINLAVDCLESQGINTRGMAPMEIATRGLHSTSDFPLILAAVTKKTLRKAYDESPQSFSPFTRRVTTPDFKNIHRLQLGDGPVLLEKLENGEYTSGTVGEGEETYAVKEYGKMLQIGRRVLVNDDLDAFSRVPAIMGRRARDLESDLIYAYLAANPVMGDGVALFHATHGNIGVAAALAEAPLAEARKLMRKQTGLGGAKLNLIPRWLGVPAALETSAEKLLSSVLANQTSQVNVFGPGGTTPMQLLVEPRLDDVSATLYYVFADVGQVDIMELCTLEGESAPVVESMIDFDTDGVKFKIRHTVGVKAIDWRGIVRNAGV
jgi:hypothetical protein